MLLAVDMRVKGFGPRASDTLKLASGFDCRRSEAPGKIIFRALRP